MSPSLCRATLNALTVALLGVLLCAASGIARGEGPPPGPPGPSGQSGPGGHAGPPPGPHDHRQGNTPGSNQDPDPVTSDTLFWCQHLQADFAVATRNETPPPQAAEFARRGTEMCARGRVREGILWLRHAFVLVATP